MVDLSNVLVQLKDVGYKTGVFQRSEVKELCNVLQPDERILQATNGHYEGGFGLLVATDHRLILIDRKIMFLTLDSIAYSMIQEVTFNYRLLNSTIHIFTSNKVLDFSSWNHGQIRSILMYAQKAMRDPKALLKEDVEAPMHTMKYENLRIPEVDIDDVPTMPQPSSPFVNENTQSSFIKSSSINTMPIEPTNLSTDRASSNYTQPALGQRNYARRYY